MLKRFLLHIFMICFVGLHVIWLKPIVGHPITIVDLTHALTSETPVFPGVNKWQLKNNPKMLLGKTQFATNDFSSSEHMGTHMDAPFHTNSLKWSIDQIPIDRLTFSAAVIDISQRASEDPDTGIQIEDILHWEEHNGRLPDGSVVFMYSNWGKYFDNSTEFLGIAHENATELHFPGFQAETCEWLVEERSINGIGVDTLSGDPGNSQSLPCHSQMFDNNLFILENIANLDKLPPVGATIRAYPMKIRGGTGAPTRVIASI